MIKANELCVGNFIVTTEINEFEFWSKIIEIKTNTVIVSNANDVVFSWLIEEIFPIRINATILETFGFEHTAKFTWEHPSHPIEIRRVGNEYWEFPMWPLLSVNSLHQLQNIYFFLSGEELIQNNKS